MAGSSCCGGSRRPPRRARLPLRLPHQARSPRRARLPRRAPKGLSSRFQQPPAKGGRRSTERSMAKISALLTLFVPTATSSPCVAVPGARLGANVQPGNISYSARTTTGATWSGSATERWLRRRPCRSPRTLHLNRPLRLRRQSCRRRKSLPQRAVVPCPSPIISGANSRTANRRGSSQHIRLVQSRAIRHQRADASLVSFADQGTPITLIFILEV